MDSPRQRHGFTPEQWAAQANLSFLRENLAKPHLHDQSASTVPYASSQSTKSLKNPLSPCSHQSKESGEKIDTNFKLTLLMSEKGHKIVFNLIIKFYLDK